MVVLQISEPDSPPWGVPSPIGDFVAPMSKKYLISHELSPENPAPTLAVTMRPELLRHPKMGANSAIKA